jgi:hypothetical protein
VERAATSAMTSGGLVRYRRGGDDIVPRARSTELGDLRDALARIRALPGLIEHAPGVFWLRGTPFMHFHTARPPRRVHAKNGTTWGKEIVLPVGADRAARAAFVREIRARYAACLRSHPRMRRRRSASTR